MQPHAKFIEGEGHGKPVQNGGDRGGAADRPAEHAVAGDAGQHENAVIQVVNMRPLHEEIHVRNGVRHDEKHQRPREQKGEEKAEE